MAEETLDALIDEALQIWNGVPIADIFIFRGAHVNVSASDVLSGGSPLTPLIVCSSQFSSVTGAPANTVPAATVTTPDGRMKLAVIYLNSQAEAAANIANIDRKKLVAMLTHEIGHSLGLGHSSQNEAVMYYSIANKPEAVLTQDDMDGLSYLYPRNEFVYEPLGCAVARDNSGGSAVWFFVILLALAGGRIQFQSRTRSE